MNKEVSRKDAKIAMKKLILLNFAGFAPLREKLLNIIGAESKLK